MLGYLRRLTIRNLVSPYGLALFSYAVFLFAWTFPPSIYTSYINEPDLMFLDPLTFVFYTSCVALFLIGVRSCRYLGVSTKEPPLARISTRMPIVYLAIPLLLATALCSVYLILFGEKINFVAMLISQQGQEIKTASESGKLSSGAIWEILLSPPVSLAAVLWWACFRASQLKMRGTGKFVYYAIFFFAFSVDIITCIAKVDRTTLMPLILGLLVIYFYRQSRAENVRLTSLLGIGVASIAGVVATFFLFSFLRGASILRLLVMAVLGYTITSYNRMAALLGGSMHYLYGGKGLYLSSFLSGGNWLNRFLGLGYLLGWPTSRQLWDSEFFSTAGAGLNPGFIWSGVFGYLYSDVGWWTLLYLFFAGLWAGYLWLGFKQGRMISVILYLWMAFWVLFWLGWNLLLDLKMFTMLEAGIMLALYDRAFIRNWKEDHKSLCGQMPTLRSSGRIARLQRVDN
ncbi:MAG: hypothetical protein WCF54_01990 [Terracidiphilus sp.]